MTFMPWSEALQLGIESIDDQHKWLVNATNRLHDEISQASPNRVVIAEVLEGLVDYTMNHFLMEEDLFLRLAYPETAGHKAEHDGFTSKTMNLLMQFEDGADLGSEALDLLKNWLQHHILQVDRAYVPFLKANGIV